MYSCVHVAMYVVISTDGASKKGVFIRWNGTVEWNSGMEWWNSGMTTPIERIL